MEKKHKGKLLTMWEVKISEHHKHNEIKSQKLVEPYGITIFVGQHCQVLAVYKDIGRKFK